MDAWIRFFVILWYHISASSFPSLATTLPFSPLLIWNHISASSLVINLSYHISFSLSLFQRFSEGLKIFWTLNLPCLLHLAQYVFLALGTFTILGDVVFLWKSGENWDGVVYIKRFFIDPDTNHGEHSTISLVFTRFGTDRSQHAHYPHLLPYQFCINQRLPSHQSHVKVGQRLNLNFYTCIRLCGTDLAAHCRTRVKLYYQSNLAGRLRLWVAAQFRVALADVVDPEQLLSHPGWLSAFRGANQSKKSQKEDILDLLLRTRKMQLCCSNAICIENTFWDSKWRCPIHSLLIFFVLLSSIYTIAWLIPVRDLPATPSTVMEKSKSFSIDCNYREETMSASDSAMDVGGEARTFGGCEGPDAM